MDQLSAHLDRGWDLAQRGDADGAETSAQRAVELSPDSPEAHNLLGFVAAMKGDSDEAIDAYQQAIMLDDTYLEAMLNAAELFLHPLGDYDQVLSLCNQVLDLTEYPDEVLDAKLLKVEALLACEERSAADKLLATVTDGQHDGATHNFLLGRAHFELEHYDKAMKRINAALSAEPGHAEAHYYRGLLCEQRDDRHGACESFLMTRQLELEMGMPPWAPNAESFLLFTTKAVESLDDSLRQYVQGAELYIADLPGTEVIVDGVDPRSLVLIDAVPPQLSGALTDLAKSLLEEEPTGEHKLAASMPTEDDKGVRIFLYALNVLRAAGSLHDVQPQIAEAMKREIETVFLSPLTDSADAVTPDGEMDS